jgi:hypothetical protein
MDTRKDMSTEMDTERTYQQIATEMDTVYNRIHLQTATAWVLYSDNTGFTGSYRDEYKSERIYTDSYSTAKDAREITRQYLYSTVCLQKSSDKLGQINSRGTNRVRDEKVY